MPVQPGCPYNFKSHKLYKTDLQILSFKSCHPDLILLLYQTDNLKLNKNPDISNAFLTKIELKFIFWRPLRKVNLPLNP